MNLPGFSTIQGAIDMQVHTAPSVYPEPVLMDCIEAARIARDAGMAALVLVDQYTPTTDRAYLVEKIVPGIRVYGSVTISLNLGGFNRRLVQSQIRYGVKMITMPVTHSLHSVHAFKSGRIPPHLGSPGLSEDEALTVFDSKGELVDAVKDILKMIADHGLVLNTGHLSPEESLAVIRHAREVGVTKIVVDHPCDPIVNATLDQQIEMAKLGAYLDHVFSKLVPMWQGSVQQVQESIKAVGPGMCLASTDCGFAARPHPVEALRLYAEVLKVMGFSVADVGVMMRDNPVRLLN
jgi:hypothetical protein